MHLPSGIDFAFRALRWALALWVLVMVVIWWLNLIATALIKKDKHDKR